MLLMLYGWMSRMTPCSWYLLPKMLEPDKGCIYQSFNLLTTSVSRQLSTMYIIDNQDWSFLYEHAAHPANRVCGGGAYYSHVKTLARTHRLTKRAVLSPLK